MGKGWVPASAGTNGATVVSFGDSFTCSKPGSFQTPEPGTVPARGRDKNDSPQSSGSTLTISAE
jgi:hypothetical protein